MYTYRAKLNAYSVYFSWLEDDVFLSFLAMGLRLEVVLGEEEGEEPAVNLEAEVSLCKAKFTEKNTSFKHFS